MRKYSNIVVAKLEEKVKELEREIAERRRAEEELKKSETSYRELSVELSNSLEELEKKELSLTKSKEAFFNMLDDVSEAYKDLQELFTGLVRAMVNALDAKSQWTKGHSLRVAMYAEEIAKEIGLEEDEIKSIHLAGLLHDIGKIGTYDYLLDKPAKLTNEEYEMVKRHPAQGEAILRGIKQLKDILPLIRHHHERIDGRAILTGSRVTISLSAQGYSMWRIPLMRLWPTGRTDPPPVLNMPCLNSENMQDNSLTPGCRRCSWGS